MSLMIKVSFFFIQLAKQYHPDTNKSAGAAEKFQEISEAYEVQCKCWYFYAFCCHIQEIISFICVPHVYSSDCLPEKSFVFTMILLPKAQFRPHNFVVCV